MKNRQKVDKKFIKRRRRTSFFILILVIVIFFLISFKTTLFTISKIEIVGNQKITTDKILKLIGNPTGENIFRVIIKKMINSLNKHPYIKEASINRRIPDKLIVNITEREEMFVLLYTSSSVYLDKEGFVLKIEPGVNSGKIPVIKGILIDNPIVGEKITSVQNDYINEMLRMVDISMNLKLLEKISTIDFTDLEKITIQFNNGIIVAFGPLNNIKYKLNYIDKILKDVEEKDILCRYIYLNRGENPVVVIDND